MKSLNLDMDLFRATSNGILLNLIAFHAGREKNTGCYASYDTMAAELGRTRAAVQKGIKKLLNEGWIHLDGYYHRCRMIKLAPKTIALIMNSSEEQTSQQETVPADMPHVDRSTQVHVDHSIHRTNSELDNEKTKELNSVCVHSNQQETVQPSSQKNEHTHTDSSSSFSGETVKKPAKRKARARKNTLPPLPLPKDLEEVISYAEKIGASKAQAVAFCKYYDSVGWIARGEVMYNWQSRLELWVETDRKRAAEKAQAQQNSTGTAPVTKLKTGTVAPYEQKYYRQDLAPQVPCSVIWDV